MRLSLRCFGVAARVRGTPGAPHPRAVRGLVEEGAAGEGEVWSHGFPRLSAEVFRFEETGQYMNGVEPTAVAKVSMSVHSSALFSFPVIL